MEYPKFEINQEVVVNGTTSTFLVKQINRQFYQDKTWRDTYQLYGYGGKWFEEHELKAALTKEEAVQAALEAIRIMWNNSVADGAVDSILDYAYQTAREAGWYDIK